jgi:hypothetical protein
LERPYIFIFGVGKIMPNNKVDDFFVEYTVANYGKMPAIIEGAWIDFVCSNSGHIHRPTILHDSHPLLVSPILQAGEKREKIKGYFPGGMTDGSVAVILPIDTSLPITGMEPVGPNFAVEDGFDIFFGATIAYRGPFSSGHETGALWRYNPDSFEFSIRGGYKYNYVK